MDTIGTYTIVRHHGQQLHDEATARRQVRSARSTRSTRRFGRWVRRPSEAGWSSLGAGPVSRSPSVGTLPACCLAEPA